MTQYCFDEIINRRNSDSSKWNLYGPEVLPFWTADMDFQSPEAVISALHARIDHGVFGYCREPEELREVIAHRLRDLYDWVVLPEEILFIPGVIDGFNRAIRVTSAPGDGVLVQTPVFGPVHQAPAYLGRECFGIQLVQAQTGRYEIDFEAFEEKAAQKPGIFILVNPHNPVGRVFTADELSRIAEICLANDIVICSDEIHSDFIFPGHQHTPIASLDGEISKKSVTLMSPSKTFNIPGLRSAFAVIQDPELRDLYNGVSSPHFPEVNILGFVATQAAYESGQEWLDQVLDYLMENRRFLVDFIDGTIPTLKVRPPEGGYLAWIDCRESCASPDPMKFFLEEAKVALADGRFYGAGGDGFVRFNFACRRSLLEEALNRMQHAITRNSK